MKTRFIKTILILLLSLIFGLLGMLNQYKSDFPLKVKLVMNTTKSDDVKLFFSTYGGFNESKSMIQRVNSGPEWQILNFELPAKRIRNLRIDPGSGVASYSFKFIKIKNRQQEISFTGIGIEDHFELIDLEKAHTSTADSLVLISKNIDPQFIYKGNLIDEITQRDQSDFILRIVLIGISYLSLILLVLFSSRMFLLIQKQIRYLKNIDLEKVNGDFVVDFIRRNKIVITSSFLIGVFSFGYELFNFSLSIDDEFATLLNAGEMKSAIITGRWGFYLLNLFFHPNSLMPYYTTALAIIFISASASLFVIHHQGNIPSKLIFLAIFISSPVHSYYLAFNLSFYYALGMLLSTIAFFALKSAVNTKGIAFRHYLTAALLLAFSIALYQSMLAFFLVLTAYFIFEETSKQSINKNQIQKLFFGIVGVSIFGLLVYKFGDYLTRFCFLVADNRNNTNYLDNFSTWALNDLKTKIVNLIITTWNYLTGLTKRNIYLGIAEKTTLILVSILAYQIISKERKSFRKVIWSLLSLLLLVISPFALLYLNGSDLPVRAMMSLPLMIAMLWFLTYQRVGKLARRVMLLMVIFILINNSYINTRLFYASNTSWESDKALAHRIAERINSLNPKHKNGLIQVAFVGDLEQSQNQLFLKSEVFGASFFNWEPGDLRRKFALLKIVGHSNFTNPSQSDYECLFDEISKMPSWPDNGSVKLFDDIVVVKLSEPKQSWQRNK
jgi:hypothetical protein